METIKNDVVVVGTGGGGMAAALTVAEGGARVIVFEEKKVLGGISNMGMEVFGVESRMLRANNVPFTKDEAFKVFMDRTHWKADARLVRAFVDKTADTIEWLQKQGVQFTLHPFFVHPDNRICTHLVLKPDGSIGRGSFAVMLRILRDRLEQRGGEIRFSTTVTKIRREGGRIVGVVAQDKKGQTFQVDAKAVIVGTGGYPHNKAMLKEHGDSELGRDLWLLPPVKLNGSGISMAWDVGAVPDGMDLAIMCGAFEVSDRDPGTVKFGTQLVGIGCLARQPYLYVNQQGQRFVDEGVFVTQYKANALKRQPDRCAYVIFDGETKRYAEEEGLDHIGPVSPDIIHVRNVDAEFRAIEDGNKGYAFSDRTLKELAGKIGVKAGALQETVEEYNKFCDKGHDDLFAKNPRYLRPVRKPRFYAIKIRDTIYGTLGGIKINERGEAVDARNEPIPGLYAVGDVANGSMTYDFALAHILQGGPMSFALNVGRIAGENAVQYVRSQDGAKGRRNR
jgi:fumarate reductase flavoprotein subunit